MREFLKKIMCFVFVFLMAISFVPDTSAQAAAPEISYTKLTITEGKSKTLKIKNSTKAVTWSSNNSKIAKVTKKGKVTAVKEGTAKITAKAGDKSYTCKVTVKPKYQLKVNIIDSLHAEFMISGLDFQEKTASDKEDKTEYAYNLTFDKYTVTLKHTGKYYTLADEETGLIELAGLSCYTTFNEGGEQNIYTTVKTYYRDNMLIIELHFSLNYSSIDLCKTTEYRCDILIDGRKKSDMEAKTEVTTYKAVKSTLPVEYTLKAKMLDASTMEIRLTDSSLQDRYMIDRTESLENRGELSWTINLKCDGQGYSITLYRGAPIAGQNRIVSPDSLYVRFSKAELDDQYNKMRAGADCEDPLLTIADRTLIFKCTVPEGFDIKNVEGFAVSVVNQELNISGEGTVFEAAEVVE